MIMHDEQTEQQARALDDADLDAVHGGMTSSGHGTRVRGKDTSKPPGPGREAIRDRDGKVVWQEIDGI